MTAPKPTVVNPARWLDDGHLPAGPPDLRARALRMAQCIEAGGPLARGFSRETLLPCQAHLDGEPCLGLLVVLKQKDDAILVFCPVCTHDELMIYEWEDTMWASGPAEPLDVMAVAAEYGLSSERTPKPGDRDDMLARALALVGCPWTPAEVRRRLASASVPSQVVQQIVDACPAAPPIASLERLLPVLFDTWNDMQASAPAARPPRTRTKVGANAPCPCGSGKKYKRCCMLHESMH